MQTPEEHSKEVIEESKNPASRPVGLSILLIFSFTYNGILFILLFIGLIYPAVIREILIQYFPSSTLPVSVAFFVTLGGVLVFAVSLAGLILLWLQRRAGFYFYASGQAAMLATLLFILKSYDLVNIAIALVILILFGLYSRNMK